MFKDYNMNQLVLPLDLEVKLQENDIAFHIHHLVESIPQEAFAPYHKLTGIVANTGYGSEANYNHILSEKECVPIIPYGMYEKEQPKKYKQDPFKTNNWIYDESSNHLSAQIRRD